jgi:hypothetical protein
MRSTCSTSYFSPARTRICILAGDFTIDWLLRGAKEFEERELLVPHRSKGINHCVKYVVVLAKSTRTDRADTAVRMVELHGAQEL